MIALRACARSWGAAVIIAVLAPALVSPPPPAVAADGSLVVAALRRLEAYYVDPVKPVPLLNAAVTVLRKATGLSARELPDVSPGTPERQAIAQFLKDATRAAQTHAMPQTPLAYLATEGMLASLHDSHTYFLTPAALRESQRQLRGAPGFTGIGVVITSRKDGAGVGWIFIDDVFPGSPAHAAGLKRFDRIVAAGGKSLKNVSALDASALLRGPAGSTVALDVERGTRTLHVSVTRAPIRVPPAEARFIQPGVAYVRMYEFSRGAGSDLRKALEGLAAQHAIRSAILDLRGNPGGLIIEAASVSGIFLPPGTVVARITSRGEPPSLLSTSGVPLLAKTPLALLVDGASASASEILAGAFKDYQRAAIVGEKTAGALGGSFVVRLPEGGMSVTVERIVSPRREQIEGVGVSPTLAVPLTVTDMEQEKDTQLQAALRAVGPPK
jgi:carboxyl-terminal processing protease